MGKGISLKTQNAPLIIIYLTWKFCFYIIFIIGYTNFWQDFISLFGQLNSKKNVFIAVAPLIAFILSGVLSAELKYIIVFWRRKNPLPGTRVFSEIGPKDPRIDMKGLKNKLKKIPKNPNEQNKIWFRLYKQVEENTSVRLAHKYFLLARDMASISLLFLLITPWLVGYYTKDTYLSVIYGSITLIEYIILCIVAQNAGNRFACNVLAEHSSKVNKSK